MLSGFKQVLLRQLIREMIAYNFPRAQWEKGGLGEFTQRELSIEEREKEWNVVEGAINTGVVDQQDLNDLNKAREIAGFPPRDKLIPKPIVDDGQDPDDNEDVDPQAD
jgi:hypothetical protein